MFTANSMNCLCEALGLALPGNGSILATDPRRDQLFKQAGEAIINLVAKDIKPRDILSHAAFENAFALMWRWRIEQHRIAHVSGCHRGGAAIPVEASE